MGVVSGTGAKALTPADYKDRQIADGLAGTAKIVYRLVLTLIGLGLFTVIALGQPDAYFLNPAATVSVPTIGATTAKAMLVFVPLLLIATRVYAQVYVDHWRALDAEADRRNLKLSAEISPMRHWLLRLVIGSVLNLLVPAALIALTWKAMALPHSWGVGLLLVTLLTIAGHLLQCCHGLRGQRIGSAGVLAVAVFAAFLVSGFGLPLRDAVRRPFDLRYADLSKTDLSGYDLRAADLRQAYLNGADLRLADLRGAWLAGAELQKADLESARLLYASFRRANLQEANLSGTTLQDGDLGWASLQEAELFRASFQEAFLFEANLQDANLRWANLQEANLSGANLQDASLYGANLQDANLLRAKLSQAQLNEACLFDMSKPPKNLPSGLKPPTSICGLFTRVTRPPAD